MSRARRSPRRSRRRARKRSQRRSPPKKYRSQHGEGKRQPVLLIVAGLTGAGKTDMRKQVFEKHGVNDDDAVKILIDDLVMADAEYKRLIDGILLKSGVITSATSTQVDNEKLLRNPTPEFIQQFSDAYHGVRKRLDPSNDAKLVTALQTKQDVCFETVGEYVPTWLLQGDPFKRYLTEGNYITIFAYAVAPLCVLAERNKTRALYDTNVYLAYKGTMNNIIENGHLMNGEIKAPRLPDVVDKRSVDRNFLTRFNQVGDTLNKLFHLCAGGSTCPTQKFYIFDTTGRPNTVVYHPDMPTGDAIKRLEQLLNAPTATCATLSLREKLARALV